MKIIWLKEAAPIDISKVKSQPSVSMIDGEVHLPWYRFPTHFRSHRMLFGQRSGVNYTSNVTSDLEKTERAGDFSGKSRKEKSEPEVTWLNWVTYKIKHWHV